MISLYLPIILFLLFCLTGEKNIKQTYYQIVAIIFIIFEGFCIYTLFSNNSDEIFWPVYILASLFLLIALVLILLLRFKDKDYKVTITELLIGSFTFFCFNGLFMAEGSTLFTNLEFYNMVAFFLPFVFCSKLFFNRVGRIINSLICVFLVLFAFKHISMPYQIFSDYGQNHFINTYLKNNSSDKYIFNFGLKDNVLLSINYLKCKVKYYDYLGNLLYNIDLNDNFSTISNRVNSNDSKTWYSLYITKITKSDEEYSDRIIVDEIAIQENVNYSDARPIKNGNNGYYTSLEDYYRNVSEAEKLGIRAIVNEELFYQESSIALPVFIYLLSSIYLLNKNLSKQKE